MSKPTLEEALGLLRRIRSEMDDCRHGCQMYQKRYGQHEPGCWCYKIAEIDTMLKAADAEE